MEKDEFKRTSRTLIASLALLILVSYAFMNVQAQTTPSEPHAANALWMEPSSMTLDIGAVDPGYKFNVTVWLNLTDTGFTWQVKILFNSTYLNASRTGYTAGATSDWATHRTEGMTVPVSPTIDNIGGSILHGESCMGVGYVPAGTVGSLVWVEFELKQEPPVGQYLTLNFTVPYGEDTFVLDADINTVTVDTIGDQSIQIVPEFASELIFLALFALSTATIIMYKKRR